jgi:RNA polymerase sigma factor (sigma-70 family)
VSEFAQQNSAPPAADISRLADHLFRHEAGKLVSVLTGIFGIERLQLAEDVVQEALVRALQTWPYYGIPKNPAAWLTQTAKNLALDVIRRETLIHEKQEQVISFLEHWGSNERPDDAASFDGEITDDRLRLMFACCHPLIAAEDQIALALKTLCGFSPAEIASAFLSSEAAIAKRLVRAKQKIRDQKIPFELPAGEELAARLDGVLHTLYLMFNEGYKASSGDQLVREDLCHEAVRLVTSLASHPAGNQPHVHALAALMLLNAARLRSRTDAEGNMLRLREQDRSTWDRKLIARGMFHLAQSGAGAEITPYHLQAGIAACHCAVADYESTDWVNILGLYDHLVRLDASPVVALNRAVALGQVNGPEAALKALDELARERTLDSYYLLYAVRADFEMRAGNPEAAAAQLRKAMELTSSKSEQAFLTERLRECEAMAR